MEAPDFWNDPEVSQNKMKEVKSLKDDVATYAALSAQYDDIETMIEMGYEENDPELIPEIDQMMKEFVQTYEDIRMKTLLSGEYDRNNAIVSLHAGAGGTESCDWAAMLYRMYTRWADKKGFSVEVLDSLDGEEAGIKSITFQVNGGERKAPLPDRRSESERLHNVCPPLCRCLPEERPHLALPQMAHGAGQEIQDPPRPVARLPRV